MADARQALALLVNSSDLPPLHFLLPAFFPTQELEGKKKKEKEDKQQRRKNKSEAQQVRKNREKANQELLSFPSQSTQAINDMKSNKHRTDGRKNGFNQHIIRPKNSVLWVDIQGRT